MTTWIANTAGVMRRHHTGRRKHIAVCDASVRLDAVLRGCKERGGLREASLRSHSRSVSGRRFRRADRINAGRGLGHTKSTAMASSTGAAGHPDSTKLIACPGSFTLGALFQPVSAFSTNVISRRASTRSICFWGREPTTVEIEPTKDVANRSGGSVTLMQGSRTARGGRFSNSGSVAGRNKGLQTRWA